MAKARMDLSTFIGKLLEEHDGDVLREGVRVLAQAIMDTEVTTLVGDERHERSDERTAYRNGSRSRTWDTRLGTIDLAIPKVRPGSGSSSVSGPSNRVSHTTTPWVVLAPPSKVLTTSPLADRTSTFTVASSARS